MMPSMAAIARLSPSQNKVWERVGFGDRGIELTGGKVIVAMRFVADIEEILR